MLTRDELNEIMANLATHRSHLYDDGLVYLEGASDLADELRGRGYVVTEDRMTAHT